MKKKFLAVAMAAVMAFSVAPTLPAATTVAQAAEEETTVINIDKQIGESDLSSVWWTAFSDHYKIEDGKSYEFNFDVYGGSENWYNFIMAFTNEAATATDEQSADYKEFAVVRADSWGWGGGDNASLNGEPIEYTNTLSETEEDMWATFRDIMTKATVSLTVSRDGNDITIEADVVGKEDASKSFEYTATFVAGYADGTDAEDVYMTLGVDHSMIMPSVEETVTTTDITETVGAEDNTAAFWSAFSKQYKIDSDKTYTFDFENHSNAANLYNNYVMIFTNEAAYNEFGQSDDYFEYAVVRADNWGWSSTGTNVSHNGDEILYGGTLNWDTYTDIITDSNVSLTINRKGALVYTEAVVTSIEDPTQSYTYTATFNLDTEDGDLYFGMTCEGSHLNIKTMSVTELTATMPESPKPADTTSSATNGTKKNILMSGVSAKLGAKTVTGTVNAPDAAVTVQVGKAAAVKATVKDKKFTATLKNKLKVGDKVVITVTADGYNDYSKTVTVKGTMTVKKVTAKKGAKKITGTVSVKKATVKVKVGKKAYKKAKVSGKKFTLKVAKLKKGTKVVVKATKKNYKAATKSVKVK
jgi:hypothetical protein